MFKNTIKVLGSNRFLINQFRNRVNKPLYEVNLTLVNFRDQIKRYNTKSIRHFSLSDINNMEEQKLSKF